MDPKGKTPETENEHCPYCKIWVSGDCEKCQTKHHMPYKCCCLTECGEHEMCRTCIDQKTGGIYYGIRRKH